MKRLFLEIIFLLLVASRLNSELVDRSGEGFSEIIDGQTILHLKGDPYELGHQHGTLLCDKIRSNVTRFIDPLYGSKTLAVVQQFLLFMPQVIPHIPLELIEEMHGLADGAHVPYENILLLNLFPEMFHCTGVVVKDKATRHGELYHVRVLDYSAAAALQDTAILVVAEPTKGIPFLNVTYAGFIGCVTGMNKEKITIGEVGNGGYNLWDGQPMAFLLRMILQSASTLDEVKAILSSTARTCDFYYIFSDGKTNEAFGTHATSELLEYFVPGESIAIPEKMDGTPDDCFIVIRSLYYDLLMERILSLYGNIDVSCLQEMIKSPITGPTNLHNAIFAPTTLEVWISHAGQKNEPAYTQPYHHFSLHTLLQRP